MGPGFRRWDGARGEARTPGEHPAPISIPGAPPAHPPAATTFLNLQLPVPTAQPRGRRYRQPGRPRPPYLPSRPAPPPSAASSRRLLAPSRASALSEEEEEKEEEEEEKEGGG